LKLSLDQTNTIPIRKQTREAVQRLLIDAILLLETEKRRTNENKINDCRKTERENKPYVKTNKIDPHRWGL